MTNAHLEGDDVPAERLRIYLYGDGFASIDGEIAMSAFGPGALQTIARKLLAVGYDSEQQLDIHRGGQLLNRVTLRAAAQQGEDF